VKVLVTGATGFVGSCLARRLIHHGYDVHVFVRKESDRWRIRDLHGRMHEHDVNLRDAGAVKKAVSAIAPRIICHLATYGGFASQRESADIFEVNFLGTVNLLRACEQTGFDLFINTGSSSEYGIKSEPMREDDLLEPIGDYGVSKAAATLFCQSEFREKNLPVLTLRLFSPFGPWDDHKRLIPSVIKSMLRGEAPRLSNPESVRDYIFIEDVIDCYMELIQKPSCPAPIFNIGSGHQYTICDIVTRISNITNAAAAPLWGTVSCRGNESPCWVSDRDKAAHLLHWSPKTSLQAGLEQTIVWLRKNLSLYS